MDRETLYSNLNQGILGERLGAFRRNLARNRDLIARHGGLERVVPLFSGKHAVVIAAGPSLEDALPALKKFQHRREVVYLAADMALAPLARAGVRPGFVISCETVPLPFFNTTDTSGMRLIAFSCMSSINLRRWKGDISFYNWMIHGEPYDALWREAGEGLGYVATGNIVTTQAVSLALGCGVASLIMVGNDLGFSRRYYARGTVPHVAGGLVADRFSTVESLDFNRLWRRRDYELKREGKSYYTSHQFLAAKYWLEDLFKGQKTPVFDAGVPGCSEKYVRHIGAGEYFARFETRNRRRR